MVENQVLKKFRLVDAESKQHVSSCSEQDPAIFASPIDEGTIDDVERQFSTRRRVFDFHGKSALQSSSSTIVSIRETDFSCGKLGHKLWQSGLVLSMVLAQVASTKIDDETALPIISYLRRQQSSRLCFLEIGAGVGLPSAVIRSLLSPS